MTNLFILSTYISQLSDLKEKVYPAGNQTQGLLPDGKVLYH